MTLNPEHIGLYFGQVAIETAKQKRADDNAAYVAAWQWLRANEGDLIREEKPKKGEPIIHHKPKLDPLSKLLEAGFRYRFLDDETAAQQAITTPMTTVITSQNPRERTMQLVAYAQVLDLLFPLVHDDIRTQYREFVTEMLNHESDDYVLRVWQMTLRIVAGVVLEDPSLFDDGVAAFKQKIDNNDIHPDGYIKPICSKGDAESFWKMTATLAGFALAAEAATQASDEDLWAYESREVTIHTPVTYMIFYYFYPDKWHWYEGVTEDDVQAAFGQFGALIEIAASHQPPRDGDIILQEARPFFGVYSGGLTTLTHGDHPQPKRRGWFGFGG